MSENQILLSASDLFKNKFWQQYVPFWHPGSGVPFRELETNEFDIPTLAGKVHVKSMLSSLELSLLYALAKDYWTGEGEIVDLGCLYGITTRCLAEGAQLNPFVPNERKRARVYAYDLFLAEDYDWWSQQSPTVHAGSWFAEFLAVNRDLLDVIVPCPGDLLHLNWDQKPIEILMIDAAKSWQLNAWIVRKMFPRLIPGKSVVIQQDYVNFAEYWCALTMEHFSDRFEHIGFIYGASGVYLNTKPISDEEAAFEIAALSPSKKIALMEAAIDKAPPSVREAMKTTYAMMLTDLGDRSGAIRLLESVDINISHERPESDFSGIAKGCVQMMSERLAINW